MCDLQNLLQKANDLHKQNIPFVIYKKPHSKKICLGYCEKNIPPKKTSQRFIFAPFADYKNHIEISLEHTIKTAVNFDDHKETVASPPLLKSVPLEKQAHIHLVKKTVDFIKKGGAKKIVVAGSTKTTTPKNFTAIFEGLITHHQNAFTYVFFHTKTGVWMGASPELLLEKKDDNFTTVALAGTKPHHLQKNNWDWTAKEIEEQEIVVEGIQNTLQKEKITPQIGTRKTVRAGHLAHLFTEIKWQTKTQNIFQLIDLLHPTAAVCGLPTEKARTFILENEKIDRSFYTGFLGVIDDKKSKAHIFVNLRCLQLENKTATIFAGGGITAKSDPEKEWEEILLKRQTMAKYL